MTESSRVSYEASTLDVRKMKAWNVHDYSHCWSSNVVTIRIFLAINWPCQPIMDLDGNRSNSNWENTRPSWTTQYDKLECNERFGKWGKETPVVPNTRDRAWPRNTPAHRNVLVDNWYLTDCFLSKTARLELFLSAQGGCWGCQKLWLQKWRATRSFLNRILSYINVQYILSQDVYRVMLCVLLMSLDD